MIRFFAGALLCVVCSSAYACDAMRPCYANGTSLYGSAGYTRISSHRSTDSHRRAGKTRRRIPEGLAHIMIESAGRAVGLIRSRSGATAHVAGRATGAFQCLVAALDRQGYPIRFMGSYRRHGSVRGSLHPAGLALDINQYSRNRTRPRMPSNEIALANACGLISGRQWANGDSGHFQLGGWSGSLRHHGRRGHRHRRYARAR